MTDNQKPYIIGVAGPSGSGKSTIAKALAEALGGSVFSLDSYYHDLSHLPLEERRQTNFDHPDSMDAELLSRDLRTLAEGKTISRPIYDFATHCRSKDSQRIVPGDYLIVEGIFTLNFEKVRSIFATKIFVEAAHDVCFARRLKRDLAERGYTEIYIRQLYDECVRPMTDRFLNPTKIYADVLIDGRESVARSAAKVLEYVRARAFTET